MEIEKDEQIEQNEDYIKAIAELKEKSVPVEKYDKLKAENRQLLDSLINGGKVEKKEEKEIDVKAIEKRLSSKDPRITTLDGFKMALELRKADLAAGKPDPFISANLRVPSQADVDAANRRAEIYQEMIDYAQGDPQVFSSELQRRLVDNSYGMRLKLNR